MLGLTFSSYKLYDSSRFQAFMMADFNTGNYNTPYEIYGEKLDDNYPNISLTALPIKFLKARYFLETDSLDQAKRLLFESIKANPYIKGPETLLSQLYFKEEKYDSALGSTESRVSRRKSRLRQHEASSILARAIEATAKKGFYREAKQKRQCGKPIA